MEAVTRCAEELDATEGFELSADEENWSGDAIDVDGPMGEVKRTLSLDAEEKTETEETMDELPEAAELGRIGATGAAEGIELTEAAVVEAIDEAADELIVATAVTLVDKATDEPNEEALVMTADELLAPPIEDSGRLTLSDDDSDEPTRAEDDSSNADERTPAVEDQQTLWTSEESRPRRHAGRYPTLSSHSSQAGTERHRPRKERDRKSGGRTEGQHRSSNVNTPADSSE